MRPHRVVTEAAELVTRHGRLAQSLEAGAHFGYEARHHHRVHIGIGQQEAVHHIGAGEPELHRRIYRYLNAARHEIVLLGNETHGDRAVGLDGRAEIAFDEFTLQMQCGGVDDLDIAGRVHRTDDAGDDDDCQHDEEHRRHENEPALLGSGHNLRGDDAVRQRAIQRIHRGLSHRRPAV